MRYIKKEKYTELRTKYSIIIGWGAGVEFKRYYDHQLLAFDHMVDGGNQNIGKIINGIEIDSVDTIKNYRDVDSVLVVIYPNIETEILPQVLEYLPKADTIMARLLDIKGRESTYSTDREDVIMLDYIRTKYDDFSYIDIGVCHSIVRNNTYLFYENGHMNGVLVEPNMEMCNLAKVYRPMNKILNCGAAPEQTDEMLTYYYDPIHPGLNTFLKDVAISRGMDKNTKQIPVTDINTIIGENFENYPNVLDIDTEGLDLELLTHLDTERFPIDLICVESCGDSAIRSGLEKKGYKLHATTQENEIYIRE